MKAAAYINAMLDQERPAQALMALRVVCLCRQAVQPVGISPSDSHLLRRNDTVAIPNESSSILHVCYMCYGHLQLLGPAGNTSLLCWPHAAVRIRPITRHTPSCSQAASLILFRYVMFVELPAPELVQQRPAMTCWHPLPRARAPANCVAATAAAAAVVIEYVQPPWYRFFLGPTSQVLCHQRQVHAHSAGQCEFGFCSQACRVHFACVHLHGCRVC
jgi:hypothetical protein